MQEESGSNQPGTQTPESDWTFQPDSQPPAPANTSISTPENAVTWTASEFIAHHKSANWYLALVGGAILLAIGVYFLTKDEISTVIVIIVAIVFGVFAARKPRELQYQLDAKGLYIAEKFYPYGNFKSFAFMHEDGIGSVWLMPLKRFMPIISIYYSPQDEQKIGDVLSQHLPLENKQPDAVDKLMHRLRF